MFDEYFSLPPSVASLVPAVIASVPADLIGSTSSTLVDKDAPSLSTSQTPPESQSLDASPGVVEEFHDIEVAHQDNDPLFGVPILEPNSKTSFSKNVIPTNAHSVNRPPEHIKVCVSQPDGFIDQDNPNHVYKLKKALYGLNWA
nr:hypothetical protein [Tanacetum cinerariifolium]